MLKFAFKAFFYFTTWIFLASSALGQDSSKITHFSGHDPNSKVHVDHQPLTDFLHETVLDVGRSYRLLGKDKPETYLASRIRVAQNISPSRYEGSRLFVHMFKETHVSFLKGYLEGLERLSMRRPITSLNRNEQLAYWLNLYNVIVLNKVVSEYPKLNLKSLRQGKRGNPSFWEEDVASVEGIPVSLSDIEAILFANYETPLVAFGLWQGAIGGPRIRNFAYSGTNVWQALEQNARELVNSNRGIRPPIGGKMKVSRFFQWMAPAFSNKDTEVLAFLRDYGEPGFIENIQKAEKLSYKIYDWQVADLVASTKHSGSHVQMGGVLSGTSGGGGPASSGTLAGSSISALLSFYDPVTASQKQSRFHELPPELYALLNGIMSHTKKPTPIIDRTSCVVHDVCMLEPVSFDF